MDFHIRLVMRFQTKKGEHNVEASFMMMNQVDSSSFHDDKDDDTKPKETP